MEMPTFFKVKDKGGHLRGL